MYQSPFCPLQPIKWMMCKKAFFFPQLVCVYCVCVCMCFIFFTHTKGQNSKPFFSFGGGWGVGTSFARDRWWVYWLLIVYTLLLPWQFFTLIFFFLRSVKIFNFLFCFPPSNKKILKENIEHSRKFYLVEMIFLFIYLFIWKIFFEACYQGMFSFFLTN